MCIYVVDISGLIYTVFFFNECDQSNSTVVNIEVSNNVHL